MSLVDIIKYEAPDDSILVWKHPSDQIKIGSQLIVNEGQQVVFVKGGQALDTFDPGTHTLSTGNIPLLDKVINFPFDKKTPFAAEIWFVNTTVKRDLKWGTPSPIPVLDPNLGFPVSVRSFGKWGIRINNVRAFTTQIVGSQAMKDSNEVYRYFIGEIIQVLTQEVTTRIVNGKKSILDIAAAIKDVSKSSKEGIENVLIEYGLELVNFNIESINIPEEELKKIQDVFTKTLEAKEFSKAETNMAYQQLKSLDILSEAAQNPSDNALGSMLGAGFGLGAGLPAGQKIGQQINIDSEPAKDQKSVSDKLKEIKSLYDDGLITKKQFETKQKELLNEL
jgi:membrane protease subunit (stomatin/prohibitin family)